MLDSLTGLANRRSFLQDAGQLAKRHAGKPRPTAVLLIDLDHFKSINDRFGHALGDRVLEIFSQAARASVRSTDLLGRFSGEEFAAVITDTTRDKAVALAERIRAAFAQAGKEVDGRPSVPRSASDWLIARSRCSTCRNCWRSPTRRSISLRNAGAIGSRLGRSRWSWHAGRAGRLRPRRRRNRSQPLPGKALPPERRNAASPSCFFHPTVATRPASPAGRRARRPACHIDQRRENSPT
ncbi:MAG: GGDEF domain-containing protein [Pseudolabrys sp.]